MDTPMTTTSRIASIIDGLGATLTLTDDDMITDVLVIAKVVEADGTVRVGVSWSDSTSWLDRRGLLSAASEIAGQVPTGPRSSDK